MYLNKAIIIGNITKDPELKALPSGQSVVNFSIATNRTWKDAQGQKQEDVEYHNIVVFGKQADTIKQYCNKGDSLLVEGRIQTRSWEVEGKKNYRTEIICENFQFGQKSKRNVDDETGEVIPDLTKTSPSPEYPNGIELKGHPFVEDKELSLDDIPTEPELNLEDIPF